MTKSHEVRLTEAAERDLDDLHDYLTKVRGSDDADEIIGELLDLAQGLTRFPDRGSVPQELELLGDQRYRQLVHFPYRIIYSRRGSIVFIQLIADGRRDMATLLRDRLLRS